MALCVPVGNWKILSLSTVIPHRRCFYIVISGAVQLAMVPVDQQFRHSWVFNHDKQGSCKLLFRNLYVDSYFNSLMYRLTGDITLYETECVVLASPYLPEIDSSQPLTILPFRAFIFANDPRWTFFHVLIPFYFSFLVMLLGKCRPVFYWVLFSLYFLV